MQLAWPVTRARSQHAPSFRRMGLGVILGSCSSGKPFRMASTDALSSVAATCKGEGRATWQNKMASTAQVAHSPTSFASPTWF
jgi:hypothetical protein